MAERSSRSKVRDRQHIWAGVGYCKGIRAWRGGRSAAREGEARTFASLPHTEEDGRKSELRKCIREIANDNEAKD